MSSNSACCSLPPVEANYTPKGNYKDVAGIKSYTVGSADAKSTILYVYDVFGYSPQILQGADLLASQGHRVVMPDFLVGDYANGSMFSGTDEGNKKRTEYFSKFPAQISTQIEPFTNVFSELKSSEGKIGAVGACWGYKVIIESLKTNKLDAFAGIHPSFAAADDAEKINVPVALLPSSGEDMDVINKIFEGVEAKNKGKNVMKEFPTMPHGWMAARGDLESEDGKKNFADGYETLAKFFKANL